MDERSSDPRLQGAKDTMTISIFADWRTDGSPLLEEVLVDRLGGSRYRLLATPGLVAGLAAGDEFEVVDAVSPDGINVLRRGGNIGVQFFVDDSLLERSEEFLRRRIASLGGRLDGKQSKLLVWTIPVEAGFPSIEGIFYEAQKEFPGSEWMFSNVYDPRDGRTPLNWW